MEKERLTSLVTSAQQGDNQALSELFNTFYNDVYYFALKTLKDGDLACDITQETFVEIINTIGSLKEPAAFVTWMKQITYHQCTRYFKKKKEVLVDEDEDGHSVFDTIKEDRSEFIPDEALDQEDFRKTILAMIDTLSEEQRATLLLYYYDELTTKSIAEIMGISEGTVKSRLIYARKAIKRSVEDYEKKTGVRLHSVALFPLIAWLFAGAGEVLPSAALPVVVGGITTATGTAIAVSGTSAAAATATATAAATGTGLLAKIAGIPVAAKIIAGITAVTVVIGSVVPTLLPDDAPTEPTIALQTEATTPTVPTTEPLATQPPVTEPPVTEPPATDPPSSDTPSTVIPESEAGGTIEEGCTYVMADGTVLYAGEAMPATCSVDDNYITEFYTYQYEPNGWKAAVNDKTLSTYPSLHTLINGGTLNSLDATFKECTNMTVAPKIPDSVTVLSWTFDGCTALKTAPHIPEGVTVMNSAFSRCFSLTQAPIIPNSVTNISHAFYNCMSLKVAPSIPNSVTIMSWTFDNCRSLTSAPRIPDGVTYLTGAFSHCYSLTVAPEIPDSVISIDNAFSGCTSLTVAPTIPEGITSMSHTFFNCTSLVTAPSVPKNVIKMDHTFNGCTSLSGAIEINANPETLEDCFARTSQPIALFGTSTKLSELAATSENGNVTVPETTGTWGDDALWNYDWSTMTLNVSGTGALPESVPTELSPLFPYIQALSIESGITEFNLDSFAKFTALITLEVPDSVTGIYEEYPWIPTLQRFVVDENNTRYCSDEYGVLYNKAMTAVDRVPWGLKGDYIVPDSVVYLRPAYSITGCDSMTNIYIGPNATDLDNYGDMEYFYCNNLLGIWVDPDNSNYCNDKHGTLFTKDMTTLLRMPQSFHGDYVIPTGVTTIGFCAFDSCSKLSSLVIPEGVKTIQQYAFTNCSSLTSLTFPASITSYGWFITKGCTSMTEVRFLGSPGWLSYETLRTFNGYNTTFYYPADNPDWDNYSLSDGNGITWIPY